LINQKRNIMIKKIQNQSEIFRLNIQNMSLKKRKMNLDQISLNLFVAKMQKRLKENENSQYNL
jgi:hypothetical protein